MVAEVAVAAVVFGPDRARHGSHRSGRPVALVLGAGGVLGAAWMTGALARLAGRPPCAPREGDPIVGTSAGCRLAAAPRGRAPSRATPARQRARAPGLLPASC